MFCKWCMHKNWPHLSVQSVWPPFASARDSEVSKLLWCWKGKKIVSSLFHEKVNWNLQCTCTIAFRVVNSPSAHQLILQTSFNESTLLHMLWVISSQKKNVVVFDLWPSYVHVGYVPDLLVHWNGNGERTWPADRSIWLNKTNYLAH